MLIMTLCLHLLRIAVFFQLNNYIVKDFRSLLLRKTPRVSSACRFLCPGDQTHLFLFIFLYFRQEPKNRVLNSLFSFLAFSWSY